MLLAASYRPPVHHTPYSLANLYSIKGNEEYDATNDIFAISVHNNYAPTIEISDPLLETISHIKSLRSWPAGWNGYDVAAPKSASIDYAIHVIPQVYKDAIGDSQKWREPHITATEDGDLMMEWSNGERNLTFYVSESEIHYIKDWGTDILNEMEDGSANSSVKRHALLTWLNES